MNNPLMDAQGQKIEYDYYAVSEADSLPEGDRLFLEVDNAPIVIFHIQGEYFAIADRCTHDDGPLGEGEVSDHQVACPRHGARFDLRSGKALTLPAVTSTPTYPVRVRKGMIEIGIPK